MERLLICLYPPLGNKDFSISWLLLVVPWRLANPKDSPLGLLSTLVLDAVLHEHTSLPPAQPGCGTSAGYQGPVLPGTAAAAEAPPSHHLTWPPSGRHTACPKNLSGMHQNRELFTRTPI